MKRADKISGVILMVVCLLVFYQSTKLEMMYRKAPGLGFYPFWLSLFALVASAVIIVNAFRRPASQDRPVQLPKGIGLRRIGLTFVAFVIYAYLITLVGFILSTAVYMLFMARMLGSRRWVSSVAVSALTAVGLFIVFKVWLKADLPTGLWGLP
jgi:putative tricarboxylic transport membrane protein